MPNKINIFITGATGYIGGSVLHRLLKHPQASTFDITALVRSPEKASRLQSHGVNAVVGSLENIELVEELASKAHVVINMAESDHEDAAKAIIRGLERGAKASIPALIHTSGTGLLMDDALGEYMSDIIYDDTDLEQFEAIPETAMHRPVDNLVVDADKKGYAKTFIIVPPTVYGLANNDLVDVGIQNKSSTSQIPNLIKVSLHRKQGGMIGDGRNVWGHVHIDDIADLYIIILDHILSGADIDHGREGIYFGENGEYTFYDLGKAVAEALVDIGMGGIRDPTTFTQEEINGLPPIFKKLGSNARCRATRSRRIGWKPTRSTADMLKSVKPELDEVLLTLSRQ